MCERKFQRSVGTIRLLIWCLFFKASQKNIISRNKHKQQKQTRDQIEAAPAKQPLATTQQSQQE